MEIPDNPAVPNPLVCLPANPMLVTFPSYMTALAEFNSNASAVMDSLLSFSSGEGEVGIELASALNYYKDALRAASFEQVFQAKGNLYVLAAYYGMDTDALLRLKAQLDVYGLCVLVLAKTEQQAIACLN
jgi:hypothetical protein